jgi:putative transposase
MKTRKMLAYKLRLYPNKEEERRLLRTKELCRQTYNKFLELYYGGEHDRFKLQALLPVWKRTDDDLVGVHSKVLQYELHRLFSNLAALRELKKRDRKVGKLRFKPSQRFRTITYNQSGFSVLPKNEKFGLLHLSKIGDIPIRLHRAIEGTIKGVTIKHMPSGKWFAFLLVDNGKVSRELVLIDTVVGIDVGLEHYAVDSDGNEIENPRHLKRELKKLRREQRRLSRKQKGSRNREKQRIVVARTHERVENQRNDFQHKLARHYIDNYDLIVTEKLDAREMIENGHLARSISDASWSSFNQKLAYKAESAGKLFVQVDARYTSQTCPRCDRVEAKSLSQRTHDCPCGYKDTRDHASSLVILERGLRKVRSERPELTLVDRRPLQPSANELQVTWLKQEALPARAG